MQSMNFGSLRSALLNTQPETRRAIVVGPPWQNAKLRIRGEHKLPKVRGYCKLGAGVGLCRLVICNISATTT